MRLTISPFGMIVSKMLEVGARTESQIQTMLQSMNIEFDSSAVNASLEYRRNVNRSARSILQTGDNSYIAHKDFVQAIYDISGRYRAKWLVSLEDPLTHEITTQHWYQDLNYLKTKGGMEADAAEYIRQSFIAQPDYEGYGGKQLVGLQLFSMEKRPYVHYNEVPDDFEG